jgi:HK97 family phage portal protein
VLSDAQFERLKSELADQYQGTANAGRPLLLEGGLDWKPMSLTPKDMDFMEAKHSAAREIALAFGVPPMLLAIPGDNTYSNYQEANRVFWRQTVLPLAGRIGAAITQWLSPSFGAGLTLAVDTDRIEALAPDRAALWDRVTNAPFLTVNEKRAATGYGALAGGDGL